MITQSEELSYPSIIISSKQFLTLQALNISPGLSPLIQNMGNDVIDPGSSKRDQEHQLQCKPVVRG
jgi:hypothetical protein